MAQDKSEPFADRLARVKAEQSRETALKRLARDGNCTENNIRRRLRVIALERRIPDAEISKALRGQNLSPFCLAHGISTDWVMYGDLKGLFRTVQDARNTSPEIEEAHAAEVAQLFRRLLPNDKTRMLNNLRQITATEREKKPRA
jgi:hypothetical protein